MESSEIVWPGRPRLESQLRPDLSREQVAVLLPFTDEFGDDGEDAAQFYGQPLGSVVGGSPAPWSWLATALVAGYLPDFEAIALALRATHSDWLNQIEDSEAKGVDGDALGWTEHADAYRSLITQLEGFVVELEERRISLLRKPGPEEPTKRFRELWREDERRASERARRARERIASAAVDDESSRTMSAKYSQAALK